VDSSRLGREAESALDVCSRNSAIPEELKAGSYIVYRWLVLVDALLTWRRQLLLGGSKPARLLGRDRGRLAELALVGGGGTERACLATASFSKIIHHLHFLEEVARSWPQRYPVENID